MLARNITENWMAQQQRSNIMDNWRAVCWPGLGANGEADGNNDATTRWRVDGANAEADGNNDATTRQAAA